MSFRIDEFSDNPQAAGLDAGERSRYTSVGFGRDPDTVPVGPDCPPPRGFQHPVLIIGQMSHGLFYLAGGNDDNGVPIEASIRTGALDQGTPRREKKYSDLAIEFEQAGVDAELVVTAFADNESTTISTTTVPGTDARERVLIDAFLDKRARNVSIDIAWSSCIPRIYFGALRYLIDEAVETVRWSSEEIDHGSPGWSTPVYAHISIRSTDIVALAVIAHRQDGTTVTTNYSLPNTSDVKRRIHVPFEAMRGALFEYKFTGNLFQLYRDESTVFVRLWGQSVLTPVKPFGDAVSVSSSEVANVRGVQ